MSYGDLQLATLAVKSERASDRAMRALLRAPRSAVAALGARPVAAVVVLIGAVGVATVLGAIVRRLPRALQRLPKAALSVAKLEGALALVRALPAPSVRSDGRRGRADVGAEQ